MIQVGYEAEPSALGAKRVAEGEARGQVGRAGMGGSSREAR
jgi:hypothetical protein